MSGITITIDGLETVIERIVEDKIGAAQPADVWLTSAEAAEYLGVARATIYDLVTDGRLPRYGEPGTRLRFRPADLNDYAEGRWRR